MALPLVPVLEHVLARCQTAGIPTVEWEGPHPSTGKHVKWRDMQMPYSLPVTPVGILNHHTAPPVPYPLDKLADRCNWSIRWPDGSVCVLNAGIAYDSGMGDPKVLDRVQQDLPVMGRSSTWPTDFTADDRISGTRWYIDCEVQHPGDGSPLPEPMLRALIVSDAAICEFNRWDPATRLLGHLEWTRRKIDPRWNGTTNQMPSIRAAVANVLGGDMLTPDEEKWVRDLKKATEDAGSNAGFPRVIIPWFRKIANLTPEAMAELEESDEVEALERKVDELAQGGVGVPLDQLRITRA